MQETGFEIAIDSLANSNKLEFPGGDSNNTYFNPLSANPTKWSNTLKQFAGNLPTHQDNTTLVPVLR